MPKLELINGPGEMQVFFFKGDTKDIIANSSHEKEMLGTVYLRK